MTTIKKKLICWESRFSFFLFFLVFCTHRDIREALTAITETDANFPPRGWNSYDSFSWTISEEQFLQNADVVSKKLLRHGYKYVVVDFLWYRRKVEGAYTDSLGFDVIDKWGRVIPDPERWPSSRDGKGFTEVAKKVHAMGLKFGIHVMRGISTQAVNANTPILDMDKVLKELDRPILYSLSPGTSATPAMAKEVSSLVNMYRVTGDDWDKWSDVAAHFNVSRDFAASNLIGAKGLRGKSWPDLDMLPMGWLTDPGSNEGPHRKSKLNLDELRTQMTLWAMSKSPLMFGGDLRKLDNTTYNIIVEPTLLKINSFSNNNMEFPYITGDNGVRSGLLGFIKKSKSQNEMSTLSSHVLVLTSCKDNKAKGWASEVLNNELTRICWKDMGGKYIPPFCLYKNKPLLTSDDEILHRHKCEGKLHLSALDSTEFCLDATPKRKLASEELKRSSFSPCRWDANQMWELNINETLANTYYGQCGVLETVKADVNSGGIRAWVATGRGGSIYLALFNLSPEKTVISVKLSDLQKIFPLRTALRKGLCTYREVWTRKDYGEAKGSISMAVAMHGCALLVLRCS